MYSKALNDTIVQKVSYVTRSRKFEVSKGSLGSKVHSDAATTHNSEITVYNRKAISSTIIHEYN